MLSAIVKYTPDETRNNLFTFGETEVIPRKASVRSLGSRKNRLLEGLYVLSGQGRGVLDFSKELCFRRFLSHRIKFQFNIAQVLFAASPAKLGLSLNLSFATLFCLFPEKSGEIKPIPKA